VSESSQPEAGTGAPKRKARGKRKSTVGQVLLASVVVLALATALSVVFVYRHLNGNLNVEDITSQLGEDRPEKVYTGNGEPLNVLVLGSDTRDCDGCQIDQEAGAEASDTTILLHISADRTRAYGVSIPRDSIVDRPDCGEDDEIPGGTDVMWNAAFSSGQAACTIEQFESETGVFVDHYVVVDFRGFKDMVNAIDGVPVCIPEDIDDPAHNIFIKAGKDRTLRDDEALNYVRARYTLGDGSDIGRIKRQQNFIAAMINKVVSAGTLTRLDRVIGFLNASTQSLTLDPELGSVAKLGRLAMQLQNIGLDKIQFITIPNAYYPSDSELAGRVHWTPPAKEVWKRISRDEPLTKRLTAGAIDASAPPGAPTPTTPTPTAGETPETPTETPSPSETPSPTTSPEEAQAAEEAGLCA
jgi:LCP family protein required for cell wall assembly